MVKTYASFSYARCKHLKAIVWQQRGAMRFSVRGFATHFFICTNVHKEDNMKKLLVVLALLLALCFVFAACDDKDKTDGEQNEQQTQQGGEQTGGGDTPEHTHAFTMQSADAKYLASAATCKAAASYYYSCECGEKGTATFTSGAHGAHSMENDVCKYCDRSASEGLEFVSNDDGTCYVSDIGTCTDTDLLIPTTSPAGDSVTSIGAFAFSHCTSLTSVTFAEDSVCESIGACAFFRCTSLTSIMIPASVTSIGGGAFDGCEKLIEVYNCSALTITVGSWGENGYVGYYAKNVYTPMSGASKLTTTADGYIFYIDGDTRYLIGKTDAYVATTLTLPANCNGSTYEIYDYAFYNCDFLTSVTIPEGVTNISYFAFGYCDSLTSITISASVMSIRNYAFDDCASLANVTFAENSQLKNIGHAAFRGCTSLITFTIPASVTSIGNEAFSWCTSLSNVMFENPNGWWVSDPKDNEATSGTSVDVSETDTAATCLTSTYGRYCWKRG